MQPILIVHGSAGGGHKSVAGAVKESLESILCEDVCEARPGVIVADSLSFGGPAFRMSYGRGYEYMAQNMQWLVDMTYQMTDRPMTQSRLVRMIEKNMAKNVDGLMDLIDENKIETVCCTHFLPMSLLCYMRRKGRFKGNIHVCVTDYQAHGFWLDKDVDQYYVATDAAAQRLIRWGIDASNVLVTGIPVRQKFTQIASRTEANTGELKILFSASGLKKQEAFRVMKELLETRVSMELSVVCGRSESLVEALSSYAVPSRVGLSINGFVNNMEEFMSAADLIITKPGGVTSTEALCVHLPMLFVSPLPGQEVLNAKIISAQGAGLVCFDRGTLKTAVRYLDADRTELASMRENCRRFAKPEAARTVARSLLAAYGV